LPFASDNPPSVATIPRGKVSCVPDDARSPLVFFLLAVAGSMNRSRHFWLRASPSPGQHIPDTANAVTAEAANLRLHTNSHRRPDADGEEATQPVRADDLPPQRLCSPSAARPRSV